MIRRNTWVLLAIFAILLAVVLILPRLEAAHPQATPTAFAQQRPFFAQGDGKPVSIQINDSKGMSLSIQSSDQQEWTIADPKGLEYPQEQVNSAGADLVSAVILDNLPNQPPLDAMGLSSPTATIEVQMDNGTKKEIKIGNQTASGSGYYVQMDNQPAVIIRKSIIDDLIGLLTAGKPPATPTAPAVESTPVQ